MKAVDFIVKHIDENGMTQSEAAAVAGMSRQNFWDKLNNRNPRFNTMTRILDAFGYQIHVARKDREPLNFCEADFFAAAEKKICTTIPWRQSWFRWVMCWKSAKS